MKSKKTEGRKTEPVPEQAIVDEAGDESFPASDPPSHSAPAAATPGPVS
jgi:hypothetical protein